MGLQERISLPFTKDRSLSPGKRYPFDQWVAPLMIAGVISSLFSIFVWGLVFSAGLFCWIADCVQQRRWILYLPPFYPFLLAFLGWAVIAVVASPDWVESVWYLKKFLKFIAIFLIYTYLSREQVQQTFLLLFLALGSSALWGLVEYFWIKDVHLMNRIDGFMSHWMTFSGQMMIGGVSLFCFLLLGRARKTSSPWMRPVLYLVLGSLLLATVLTFTRSAWVGLAGGMLIALILVRVRLAAAGALVFLLIFVALPSQFKARFYSSFDLSDTTTRGRLELLKTGAQLIESSPWIGVGPRLVQKTALNSRESSDFPDEVYQHLHNNVLQIGAELGIPAALIWVAFWFWLFRNFFSMRKADPETQFLAINALSLIVAVQLMGLFEYNLGDSEIAILMLFMVTAPYVVGRKPRRNRASRFG